jgi:tetratricopeptide (TPR) repeat protein
VCPAGMLPVYEPWQANTASIWQLLPGLILIGALIWFWTQRKSWGRPVLLGVGFFLINLLPVIGSIQLQYSSMVWSLDHLDYLPLIGLIGLAVAGVEQISLRLPALPRRFGGGIVALVIVLMAWESHLYASAFASPYKMWTYTLVRDPESSIAHANLGNIFLEHRRLNEAFGEFTLALKINPENSEAQTGLANALFYNGQTSEAIPHFEAALKHNPNYTPAYNGLANTLMQMGDLAKAKTTCEEALRVDPRSFRRDRGV